MSRYDVEKFEPPPDPELVCCICTFVLDKPMESPCQHVFCKQCIETWLAQRRTCPTCRKKVSKRDLKPVLPLVQNMLNKLTMVCDFQENGCPVKPSLELYPSHISKCDFELLVCKYSKCQAQILRRDMANHENELCEFREVLCLRQCGLHIPIRDMESHDCMLALKKHAEERQKHAEELEARLQQLMSLQQSLRQDVENLRRQVEQERRRRPSQDGWSSSSWDSWDDDDQNTNVFFESDSDPPVGNSQLSTDSNTSPDPASREVLSDSDVEGGRSSRTWRRSRPLSVSSNNSDDLEIVEEVAPAAGNAATSPTVTASTNVATSANVDGNTVVSEVIEFVNEGEDTVVVDGGGDNAVTDGTAPSAEGGSGNQILTALDVVRDFVDSVFTQNQMVREFVNTHFSQNQNVPSIQQLLQQISDCRLAFSGVSDLNLSSSTWEAVCKFLTDIVSSLLRLRTNQTGWYVTSTPLSSTPIQNDMTDTSVIQNSIASGYTSSVAADPDRFNSTVVTESELAETSAVNYHAETWSFTDGSTHNSLVAPQEDILSNQEQQMCENNRPSRQQSEAGILPLTSDVTSTSGLIITSHPTEDHTSVTIQPFNESVNSAFMNEIDSVCHFPTPLTRNVGSEDILDLLSSEEDRGSHGFSSFELTEGRDTTRNSDGFGNTSIAIPSTTVTRTDSEHVLDAESQSDRTDRTIPSDDSCICISSTDDLEDIDDTVGSDVKKRYVSAGETSIIIKEEDIIPPSYQDIKQRCLSFHRESERPGQRQEASKRSHLTTDPNEPLMKKLAVATDLLIGIKEGLVSKHEHGTGVGRINTKSMRSRPISCTVTSAIETVPIYNHRSDCNGNSHSNVQRKGESHKQHQATGTPSATNRPTHQQESTISSNQRRRQIAETPVRPQECTDVQIPPRTAQLLVDYSEESDTSWEPGNSDVEQSDDMSLTDDVESDSSYEVRVPKPLYQIIEEMAAEDEDSDDSWTPS